jgi:raffinose/stachyose/melibiose transport system permease protein
VDGGPVGTTDVLGLLFYRTAFTGGVNAFGTASALAVVMFVAIFGVSMTARWWFNRLEEGLT